MTKRLLTTVRLVFFETASGSFGGCWVEKARYDRACEHTVTYNEYPDFDLQESDHCYFRPEDYERGILALETAGQCEIPAFSDSELTRETIPLSLYIKEDKIMYGACTLKLTIDDLLGKEVERWR